MEKKKFVLPLMALAAATAWRQILFYDHLLWASLIRRDAELIPSWMVLSIASWCAMGLSLLFLTEANAFLLLIAAMTASAVILVLATVFPVLGCTCVIPIFFGVTAGAAYMAILYYASLRIQPEIRIGSMAAIQIFVSIAVFLWMEYAASLGIHLKLVYLLLLMAVPVAAVRAASFFGVQPAAGGEAGPPRARKPVIIRPMPACLGAVVCVVSFSDYFCIFFNQSGYGAQNFLIDRPALAWLGLAVRVSACAVCLACCRKLRIASLFYVVQGVFILAFTFALAGDDFDFLEWILFKAADGIGSVALYTAIGAIIWKYIGNLNFVSLLLFSPGVGILTGEFAERAAAAMIAHKPQPFFLVPLLVLGTLFFVLPAMKKIITDEIDLDRDDSPGILVRPFSEENGDGIFPESELIRRRRRIADCLAEINRDFDEKFRLTKREMEIASYLVERYDYESIAGKLLISVNTLKAHVKNIYRKFDLTGRKALVELVEKRIAAQVVKT